MNRGEISIRPFDETLSGVYETFLGSRPEGWIYYSLRYKRFLEDLLGCESRYLVAVRDGAVCGIAPAMLRPGRFGTVINSLPFFGSHGGVLADGELVAARLVEAYGLLAEQAAALVLVAHPFERVDYSPLGANFWDTRISQTTPLLRGESQERLWMSFDGSVRRNVRKAEKEGVTVTVENDMLPFLRQVHAENMQTMGGTAKRQRFFDLIPVHFRPESDFKLYVARSNGEPVAALLLLLHDGVVEYFVPAIMAEARSKQPLAGIIFRAMCDAREEGARLWNWGGTWTTQEGVYRFKRKWAAHETPYTYHIKVNNRDMLAADAGSLLQEYPNFYTVPFSMLTSEQSAVADGAQQGRQHG